jgi:hypothetical protein
VRTLGQVVGEGALERVLAHFRDGCATTSDRKTTAKESVQYWTTFFWGRPPTLRKGIKSLVGNWSRSYSAQGVRRCSHSRSMLTAPHQPICQSGQPYEQPARAQPYKFLAWPTACEWRYAARDQRTGWHAAVGDCRGPHLSCWCDRNKVLNSDGEARSDRRRASVLYCCMCLISSQVGPGLGYSLARAFVRLLPPPRDHANRNARPPKDMP